MSGACPDEGPGPEHIAVMADIAARKGDRFPRRSDTTCSERAPETGICRFLPALIGV